MFTSGWASSINAYAVVRPAVGATLGYLLGHESSSLDAAVSAAAGGFSALASHAVKAGLRVAVNSSPEPASNVAVSTAEDVTVAAVVTLAAFHPWAAASVAAVLVVIGIVLVVFLLGRIRRFMRRYDRAGDTTEPAIRPSRRYDRAGDTREPPTSPD